MLKRQDSSLSSSRRQAAAATPPPAESHHAKAIGCMSGFIQLFSKYHHNPNKRLTFGRKKQEKIKPALSTPPTHNKIDFDDAVIKPTCENKVPARSPTLPPEIRRSDAAAVRSPENARTPPSSLVARLMGLDDLSGGTKKSTADDDEEDRIREKRRRLLEALEKCNEDLEALKRIIKAVQNAPPARKCTDAAPAVEEGNIPAGVVRSSNAGTLRVPQQRKTTITKKPGEDDEPIAKLLNKSRITESSLHMRRQAAAAITPSWCSRAMVQSVEEVCGDIVWGEKREIGRIGLVLQDHLYRELVDELVKELKSCKNIHSLPFDACKRRLCF